VAEQDIAEQGVDEGSGDERSVSRPDTGDTSS
jgi:hypothetical protein